MTRPILELVVGTTPTGWVTPLLDPLRQWCEPRAGDPSLPTPAARLVIGADAPGLHGLLDQRDIPLAIATLDPESLDTAIRGQTSAIVAPAGHEGGSDVLTLPERAVDVRTHQPVSPFVRSRWRRRLGLADDLVVDLRDGLAGDDVPRSTVIALAAAVVATEDAALVALALGTPTVLEAEAARRSGLDTFEHEDAFVVADSHEARAQAEMLADDLPRAAELGHRARRLAERSFSARDVARSLAGRLGLDRPAPLGLSGLARAFDDLRTPPVSAPVLRSLNALAPIVETADLADAGAGR